MIDQYGNIEILTHEEIARRSDRCYSAPAADLVDEEADRTVHKSISQGVSVVTGGTDNSEIIAALQRAEADVVVGGDFGAGGPILHTDEMARDAAVVGSPSRHSAFGASRRHSLVHSNRRSIALMLAIAAGLGAGGSEAGPMTGRTLSRLNSQREEEERRRGIINAGRAAGMHPAFATPYGKPQATTPEDLARIAAAEAKRARRAAKKGNK